MSLPLHSIKPLVLSDTFLDLYIRVNDTITVVNAIKVYDVQVTGGIIHKRLLTNGNTAAAEVLQLNLGKTGSHSYGLGLLSHANPLAVVGPEWEGGTWALRLNYDTLETASAFSTGGSTAYVSEYDYVSVAATGSRGDGQWRPLKVFAKDSLPHTIGGNHRFSGDIYFDGSKVVVNSSEFHVDDRLIFIASAGNTDDPTLVSGLTNDVGLAGGSGAGIVIKGASGDKRIVFNNSDGKTGYYSFLLSENIQTGPGKGFVSTSGEFKFVGVSGSAPMLALRTAGQDSATTPVGWKIYQSATGDSVGTLKIRREGVASTDALELFNNSEVRIGTLHEGTGGDGSFKTRAAQFSVPAVRGTGVLHYGWQNRDAVPLAATANGGLFAEPVSAFKPGTILSLNTQGHYIRARWDALPVDGYREAEVVGILEKTVTDYLIRLPLTGGTSYTSSIFELNENVTIVGQGNRTVSGYVYDNLPGAGLSGVTFFITGFGSGVTPGSFTPNNSFFIGGATVYGSRDNDAIGICGSIGGTVSTLNQAIIVRQGVFDIPTQGIGATGYDSIYNLGLSAGYLFYLGGTLGGNDSNCYGGVTYSPNNLFDPEVFFRGGANVAKPLFIYLGTVEGRRIGLFNHYQGLGLTYSLTTPDSQPVYYSPDTNEITNFGLIGEVGGGKNKIMNSGFDLWTRLDTAGGTYSGAEGTTYTGITFGVTPRSLYPFGTTYNSGGAIRAGYVADGYFFNTYSHNREIGVRRQAISSYAGLDTLSTPPENELVLTQQNSNSGVVRLYALVSNHRNLQESQMNFSFFGKASAPTGITVGVAFVYPNGSTYAMIESYHTALASGTGSSGGRFYGATLGNSYQRYNFPFSSFDLNLDQTANRNSFVAPFIEINSSLLTAGSTLATTGWQLTKGMSVKPYEKRSFAEEKAEADRFFQNVVVAHGGYFPVSTGQSGPALFTAANLPVPLAHNPTVVGAVDIQLRGVSGGSTTDASRARRNYLSVFRSTDPTSTTYHRYFETVYSLDASGFSGTVNSRLLGLT